MIAFGSCCQAAPCTPRSRPRGGRGRGNRRARRELVSCEWRGKCLQDAVSELVGRDAARHFARE
eukprot:7463594-Pyramimonas_sp.AAC.1